MVVSANNDAMLVDTPLQTGLSQSGPAVQSEPSGFTRGSLRLELSLDSQPKMAERPADSSGSTLNVVEVPSQTLVDKAIASASQPR